jgi:hypothetical protein
MRPYGNKLEIELVPDDVDIFEVLDEMDWKLEELLISLCQGRTLFQYLAQSNQSKTIRKLTLDDTEIGTPHSLRSMTALTTLDMEFPSEDLQAIDLTDYLNGCPATLKRFSINHAYLEMNPSLTSVNHIETLIIKGCEITKDLGAIISTCFPNLIRLTLSGVLLENVDILLYSHSVTFASFDIGKTGSYGCVFKSQGQVGAHHYEYSKIQKLSLFESVSILPKLTVSYFT